MESSESPDSKNVTTISHGQASSSGNDQAIASQDGNIDQQEPGSDAAMNPCSSRQALSNQIANVPNDNVLLNNDLNPRPPINEQQQNGLNDQPPPLRRRRGLVARRRRNAYQILRKVPHFHFNFGNQNWTYNDFSQRITVRQRRRPRRPRPPIENREQRPQVNICHRLPTNACQPTPAQQRDREQNQERSTPPPLISRREIEPGIFQEIYSHGQYWADRPVMLGVDRCICQNFVNYNQGNSEMITVIINTPNLMLRFSMTTSREAHFHELFDAYFGLTGTSVRTVFVACGRRLRRADTPRAIGMNDNDNIYTFISSTKGYNFSNTTTDNSK